MKQQVNYQKEGFWGDFLGGFLNGLVDSLGGDDDDDDD